MSDLNEVILAGGTGALDPALYDERVAGFGSTVQDLQREDPAPLTFRSGAPLSWPELWLGVD